MSQEAKQLSTVADLLAVHKDEGMELVDGELVYKAQPTFEHGRLQTRIAGTVFTFDRSGNGGDGPSGWWITTEVEVQYTDHNCYRHDVVGWQRQRVPDRPSGYPVKERPDFVCEVLSKSNRSNDTVRKFRNLFFGSGPLLLDS